MKENQTAVLNKRSIKFVTISLYLFITACGGGGGGGGGSTSSTSAVTNQAFGGAWKGTDPYGITWYALSTDNGKFRFISLNTREQGHGTGSVSGNTATINYTLIPPVGYTLTAQLGGGASSACNGSGTIQQRQTFAATMNCTDTGTNATWASSVSLAYLSLYDRDSSLSTIAGNYLDGAYTLNINSDGTIFEQIPSTGCVVNGQVSIIDTAFNAYDVTVTYSNCVSGWWIYINGQTFTGLATLDNTVQPEVLIGGLNGTSTNGYHFSVTFEFPRL